ncbi:hypothetical protein [Mycobacteroides immunogenum]|uniref:Uncharacterized protein n=1 Tax=Mycobacteroides immunogenum TaxID=83262 RepID=A0A7V8RXK6_9MYCO|nr:hypothetical protein [Mycobacteroides immunogenum]KPG13759.1 hypothetical protein AN909_05820 [Mycobacteroides immunogenum]KPG14249.1 hypothetical protein AN908_06575 [Mycobacteroides immunogenum]KPG14327.1 hypothetical protein AN908_07100 [Mycobacteroides immunogenum]KPG17473.1 hypothetical protein AN910_05045 [Mycobacteroides immunogenum]KPG23942.1 hypothetical protein AN911_00110 [Mycobacteroides immunogenum]
MSALEALAEAAEQYFQYLESDGYYPAGCSGEAAAAAILEVLKAKRIELVELPEPDERFFRLVKFGDNRVGTICVQFDKFGPPKIFSDGYDLTPDQSRSIAGRFLAAAAAADGSTGGETDA